MIAAAAYAAWGMKLPFSMGSRPRLSADAAFAAYSNPGLAPGDYSMNPVPLGIVFVFSILQRFFGEPSGYKLCWARLGVLGIEHQGRLLPPPTRLGGWSYRVPWAHAHG